MGAFPFLVDVGCDMRKRVHEMGEENKKTNNR
jgi:hypothetical protein